MKGGIMESQAGFDPAAGDGPITVTDLTATGNVSLGDAPTDTLGVLGAPGQARPADYSGTSAAVQRNHTAVTSTALATTAATNVTPFGFTTAAQADDIATQVNAIRSDIATVKAVLNQVIADLEAYGFINRV